MVNLNLSNGKSICADSAGWDMCLMSSPEIQCKERDKHALSRGYGIIPLYPAERNRVYPPYFVEWNEPGFNKRGP